MASLSIVIPTHDRPATLARAVDSAVAACPKNGEILVVNDNTGGAPVTRAIRENARVRVVGGGPFGGASAARNAGVRAARAPIVLFLDDDDELLPGYPERVLDHAASPAAPKAGYCAIAAPDRGGEQKTEKLDGGLVPGTAPAKRSFAGLGMGFWIERETFLRLGGLDPDLRSDEDTDLCCRLAAAGLPLWVDRFRGVRVHSDRGAADAQLTGPASSFAASESYRKTLEKNLHRFSKARHMQWFLLSRYIRRAIKDGKSREALAVALGRGNLRLRLAGLAYWSAKVLSNRRRAGARY